MKIEFYGGPLDQQTVTRETASGSVSAFRDRSGEPIRQTAARQAKDLDGGVYCRDPDASRPGKSIYRWDPRPPDLLWPLTRGQARSTTIGCADCGNAQPVRIREVIVPAGVMIDCGHCGRPLPRRPGE